MCWRPGFLLQFTEDLTSVPLCVCVCSGFLDSQLLREADEDSEVNLNYPTMTEEEREEIQQELAKVRLKNMAALRRTLSKTCP